MIKPETVANSFIQLFLRLVGYVNVLICFDAEYLSLMIKDTMHDSITKGFRNYKFHIFLWNIQFLRDIWKVDVWISERDLSETNAYHNLIEAKNQSIKSVFLIGWFVMLNEAIKAV